MTEITLRCRFGERRKAGKLVRGPTCTNRASGIFEIHFRRGKPQIMALCADCAFVKMPNRVRMIVPQDDEPVRFFRDVVGVKLLTTLGTKFNQEQATNVAGAKHWVNPREELQGIVGIGPVKVIKPRGRKMDMGKYLDSLKNHDDGK